jgi:CRP/FNR family cyclic AMP-dependent transcriptional regulator
LERQLPYLKASTAGGKAMKDCSNCTQTKTQTFCSLSERLRQFLETNSIPVEYRRGNVLFRQGDDALGIFVICSGRVKISAGSREGRTLILRIASEGDVLGMGAALSGGEYEITAEAVEPCKVRVLRSNLFKRMLEERAEASLGVARVLAKDYRAAFDGACRIALAGSPAARLARLLLDCSVNAERDTSNSTVTMPLTHEELASMTATTRETVTRTLSRFRREKLIATRGAVLNVLQPAALDRLAAS